MIKLTEITSSQKPLLQNLLEVYLQELYPSKKKDYPFLDSYWEESNRHPFFIRSIEQIIGFVLINQHHEIKQVPEPHSIAELYVLPEYRKKGLGTVAANLAFQRFPGNWEIMVDSKNHGGLAFWRKVAHEVANGSFQEIKNEEKGKFFIIFSSA